MFGDSQNKRMREHSRRISRDVNRSTIGSHAGGSVHGRHANYGSDLYFSSRRKSARANSGLIRVVTPNTTSGEDQRAYSRRVSQLDFSKRALRRDRVRRVGLVAAILIVIALVVGGVAACTYISSVSSKMSLDDADARALLVAPTDGQPYYVLVAGVFAEPGASENADALMLARVDTGSKQVSLLSLPSNMQIESSTGAAGLAAQAYETGGDAALIEAASSMAGVDISHYVRIDAEGLVRMVDAVGGITVNVEEEVDDPYAGSIYIAPGEQTLSGEQALVYARARNYSDSTIQRQDNQLEIATALMQKVLDLGTAGLPGFVDTLAECVKTDYSAANITSLVESLRGMDVSSISKAHAPGYIATNSSGRVEFSQSSSWSSALDSFRQNGSFEQTASVDASNVDPSSFTVVVRNGGGITGAAANFASILTEQGFNVTDVGNADSQVYEETLVVYKDEDKAACAQAVADAMGVGRTTNASAYYSFDSDVLVMIGRDYAPTS